MAELEYRIGNLTLRPGLELRDATTSIPIGGRALELLTALAHAEGRVLAKDELCAAVWANTIVEENTLQAQISAARKALGTEARRLVTIHGRGYRLDLDRLGESSHKFDGASIAVLPFENTGGSAEHVYLADGLAEELIHTLARIPGLKIPARTSSFAYRGKAVDVRTIASELGVATVLEGTIRADGERLRVGVQLIDAGSGFTIWSGSFDRTLDSILALQDELASAIAVALQQELAPRLTKTKSSEAVRLVLEARVASRSVRTEGLKAAVSLAREAIEIDPAFAGAWESLAGTKFVMATWGFASGDLIHEAKAHAQRALELDSTLAGAHAILAGIAASEGKLIESVVLYERALVLEPADGAVAEHAIMAAYLPAGKISHATALADRCIALAPRSSMTRLIRASCAQAQGDAANLRRNLNDGLRLGQATSRWLVECLQYEVALSDEDINGTIDALASLFERELALPTARQDLRFIITAIVEGAGRSEAVVRTMTLFEQVDRNGRLWSHMGNLGLFVQLAVRLESLDAGFTMINRIGPFWRKTNRLLLATLTQFWAPHMTPLRRDPRFQDLVRELDLSSFWKRHGPPDGHRMKGDRLIEL